MVGRSQSFDIHKRIGNEFEEPRERDAAIVKLYQLYGRITVPSSNVSDSIEDTLRRGCDFNCFTQNADNDESYFSEMKFFTTPGWSLGDYRPGTLQLWDRVRELTNKYFEKRKPKTD